MGEKSVEIIFPKLNHFWMDAGLLGLYRLAQKEQSKESGVEIFLDASGVSFKGSENNIQSFLQKTYDRLLKDYYNTSSQTQIEKKEGFYYDTKKDQFIRFPKVKPMGIAGLVKISGQSYKNKGVAKLVKSKEAQKKLQYPQLEEKFAYLQDRFEKFLADTKLKPGPSLLLDGKNVVTPTIHIEKLSGKSKGLCFICGQESHSLSEIGGTVFPFITGSSGVLSFNSSGSNAEKVCWKCDFISKFVPVAGFYSMDFDSKKQPRTHIYFPYSASLEKMNDVFRNLYATKIDEPNLTKNFDNTRLGGYFQKPYEQFLTFLYSLYRVVMTKRLPDATDDEYELDYEALLQVNLDKAPLDFFVVYTESLGDTQMGKMIWSFQESVYIFRLFDYLERNKIDIKKVMTLLVDFDQPKNESKTILRNRVCENILKKRSVIDQIEQHVFRINKSKTPNIRPLNDFVILYEKIIREGGSTMEQETIDIAVSVGKTIGMSIAPSGKKGKGDLFRLRKSRKPEDFLNEINRIQMKYGTKVNADLYNKGQKMEENFTEFKQFCMIAALNTYNAGNLTPVETSGKTKVEA
jgi:hypothetical protein